MLRGSGKEVGVSCFNDVVGRSKHREAMQKIPKANEWRLDVDVISIIARREFS